MSARFAGKTALITGAGTGIGAASVQRLGAEGANFVAMGRRAEPLKAVTDSIGGLAFAGDAANPQDAKAAVVSAKDRFGSLEVVVANAGSHGFGTILETDDSEWRATSTANLDMSMVLPRATLPHLQTAKGAICVTASIASLAAPAGAFGYTVMKHAQIGLVRAIA